MAMPGSRFYMLAFGGGLLGVAAACSGTGSSESGSSAGAGSPNAGTSGAIQPAAGGGSPGLGAAGVSGGAGGVSCPTAPPFDSSDAELVAMCAKIVYASVGDNLRRALSFDGTTWTNDVEYTDAS